MKKAKRLVSLLLAVVMLLSLAVGVVASPAESPASPAEDVDQTVNCDGYRVAAKEEKSDDIIQITTNDSGNLLSDNEQHKQKASDASVIKVQNCSGFELPAAGGIGTTIFYVAGAILIIGAIILLIVKNHTNGDK